MFQTPVFWANTAGGDPAEVIARGKCFLSHIGPLAENGAFLVDALGWFP